MKGTLAIAAAVVALAACGEYEHGLDAKGRSYAGKVDGQPWNGEAPEAKGRYTAGDRTSWEAALRARAQNQNEYTRAK